MNVKLMQAMQCILDLGMDIDGQLNYIDELRKDVSYWKTQYEDLAAAHKDTTNALVSVKARNDGLASEIIELNKLNKNLRNQVAEVIQVKDRVLQELSDDHNAFDEERRKLVARADELFDSKQEVAVELEKTKELLERADLEVEASHERIEELEARLRDAMPKLPEPKKREISKRRSPEPEIAEEVPIVQDDTATMPEEYLKRDYYFYIESMPMPGTTITNIEEINEVRYSRNKNNRGYFSYHEAPNTTRDNKFGDLVEMYPPTAYHISLLDNDEQAKYNFAKTKYVALNSRLSGIALTGRETEGYDPV